jgi:hypothetical protein
VLHRAGWRGVLISKLRYKRLPFNPQLTPRSRESPPTNSVEMGNGIPQAAALAMPYPLTMNKIVIESDGSAFVVRPPFGGRSHQQSERHVVDFLKALEKDLQQAMDDVRARIEEFEGKAQAI